MMESKYYKYIFAIILVAPIVVNIILYCTNPIPWLIPIVGESSDWIGFWGSYAGAIIGGLITLLVLHYTIKENSKVRDIQVKTIKYTQQQTWLESLRKQLIDNYRILDIQSFVIAVNEMQRGAYDKARSILLAINQNIEFQSQGSSLYFIIENPSEEEEAYKNCMSLFLAEYGTLIADLLFFCGIFSNITQKTTPADIIEQAQMSQKILHEAYKFSPILLECYNKRSAIPKIISLPIDSQFTDKFQSIYNDTIISSSQIHNHKYELMARTEDVIRYETRRINQIIE